MNNLPGSPWKRSGIIARAGVKTGGNYIRHHVGNALPIKSLHQDKETLNRKNALSLIKELSQLRGAALKMAQGLSMDTGILPEEFSEVMNAAQYRVPAMNRSLVRTQFKSTVGSEPEEFFKRFEYEAFAAATIGQVHRAEDKQGRALAVKIQYPNVQKSIESDLSLLKTIAASFLRKFDLNEHLDEMKLRLIEETDYLREGENLVHFSKTFHSPWIVFPKYFKEYSNSKVLSMSLLEGTHLDELLKENPDQSRRDSFGQVLWDFFHLHIEQNVHTFHADIHPGNFLFLPDGRVGVIDFGCVKTFPEDFLDGCIRLVQNYLSGNHSGFTDELVKMEFLKNSDAEEATEKMIKELLTEFAELLSDVYQKPVFDFSDSSFREKLNAMFKKGMEIREIRGSRHFVFFNRIVFGLLSILMKLGSRIETGKGQQAVMGWKMKAAA